MKRIMPLLPILALTACVGQYHPTSAYPPTPDRHVAFAYCVDQAFKGTGDYPGLAMNLLVAETRTQIQDACMWRHGWARN